MPSQLGLKTIVMDLLINISKSRDNHFQPIFAMDLNAHEIGWPRFQTHFHLIYKLLKFCNLQYAFLLKGHIIGSSLSNFSLREKCRLQK